MRVAFLAVAAVLLAVSMARALEPPPEYQLIVREPAGVDRLNEPVTTGVPFARGRLRSAEASAFSLADSAGKAVPLQTRVLQQWPDGSVKWMLLDFPASVKANQSAEFTWTHDRRAAAALPIKVADAADQLVIDTGRAEFTLSKKTFDLFSSVKIEGREALSSKSGGVVITDAENKRHTSTADLSEGYKLEVVEAGPLRTVVRATGEMTADAVNKIGFTCWYHFYAGSESVRVFFTIRVLNGKSITVTEQRPTKDLGYMKSSLQQPGNFALEGIDLILPVASADQYAIGGEAKPLAEKLDASVKLYQDSTAGWAWQAGDGNIVDPRLKANKEWMAKNAPGPAKEKPYYEFEKGFFDLMTNKEYGFGYTFRGYKVYDGAGKEVAAGDRAPGWVQLGDTTVGIRWFWENCPKAIELKKDGTIRLGLWPTEFSSPFLFEGRIHKTHELLFSFGGTPGGQAAQTTFTRFNRRLLAEAPKEYYCASEAFNGLLMPEDRQHFARFEDWALTAVVAGLNKNINVAFDSSIELEREKLDEYGVWHFGDTNKEPGGRGFGQYLELDIPYCLTVHFARTNNRAFFDEGEIAVRHLMDIPAHGGGYGHQAGESSHYYTTGSMFYYFLTGLEFIKEGLKVSHDVFAKPAPWHMRSFTMTMWSNLDMYRLFGEPQYLDKIKADWDWFVKGQDPATGFREYGEKNFQEFMLAMGMDAMGRYGMEFPEDQEYRDRLVALSNATMRTHEKGGLGYTENFKPKQSNKKDIGPWRQNNSNCNGHAYAYLFTGRDKHFDFAGKLLDESVRCAEGYKGEGLDPEWPRYRTGTASGKYWSEFGHRNTQTCMWARWNRMLNGTPKPPAAIKDLAATIDGNKITLTWTVPAAPQGRVQKYFVKLANKPIQDDVETMEAGNAAANWWITPLVKEPASAPAGPGTKQTMTIAAPSAGPVYVAIRSAREAGWITAVSEMSNVVEVRK